MIKLSLINLFNSINLEHSTRVEVSVLSQPERINLTGEAKIVADLRPFIDGLIFKSQGKRGTFLPTVWKQISAPAEFLRNLKRKAGFDVDYWSNDVEVYRYNTETW